MKEPATSAHNNLKRDLKSHRTARDIISKRERIINVVEIVSFTVYSNLNFLFCSL